MDLVVEAEDFVGVGWKGEGEESEFFFFCWRWSSCHCGVFGDCFVLLIFGRVWWKVVVCLRSRMLNSLT